MMAFLSNLFRKCQPEPKMQAPLAPAHSGRMIRVGGAVTPATEAEYVVACLPPNTPIEWGGGDGRWGVPASGVGVLLYSWHYDGVMAEVQAGMRRLTLHAYLPGLWVRRLDDMSQLEGLGMNGDGI